MSSVLWKSPRSDSKEHLDPSEENSLNLFFFVIIEFRFNGDRLLEMDQASLTLKHYPGFGVDHFTES